MNYVVGSGPTAISCAYALLQNGNPVTMLDVGHELEQSRLHNIAQLQSSAKSGWVSPLTDFLRSGMEAGSSGIPLKLAYGSDFPYRSVPAANEIHLENADLKTSLARGGFSNVWGSAVMPYIDADLNAWPIKTAALAAHYNAVFDFMPLAARQDRLMREFPLYTDSFQPLQMSNQAASFLHDMEKAESKLEAQKIRFGAARLAVAARRGDTNCVYCSLCMYGCPHQLIYTSSATVDFLKTFEKFTYAPGFYVRSVSESSTGVSLQCVDINSGEERLFSGDRAYLGAGVLSTAALVIRSLDQPDTELELLDSQYFLLPILRFAGTAKVRKEDLHTLAQLFLEINDPELSPYTIHLQTYTYNDLFEAPIRAAFGPLTSVMPTESLVSRLILFQGYLHSDHSAKLRLRLRKGQPQDVLEVTGVEHPATRKILNKLIRKLATVSTSLRAVPLPMMLKPGKPGRGFHCGGTFPMSDTPGPLQTDTYGRLSGFSRLHLVDSSVFPSIPATTITLTAMANAHRIGAGLEYYA